MRESGEGTAALMNFGAGGGVLPLLKTVGSVSGVAISSFFCEFSAEE